ncbi:MULTISPECIES: putative DNA modification/repair radical SAM protein [Calditerrivibrio]|uniref:putative DNA modification/repair radical SAM protein n=1 Tax=Calditerrivibrio TaxID=545865 RepID=UPI003C724F93
MDIVQKIEILSDAAKYDVSCSSSGSKRETPPGGIGNGAMSGICHTWSADGRCVSLLKILMTNICIYDCAYCYNRRSNDIKRAIFTPKEIAELTVEFYKRNYIEGLFLSSGVVRSPDYTMELMLKTAELLRNRYHYGGYLHVKLIPGASEELIKKVAALADRVSANIELPTEGSLKTLAPEKDRKKIDKSFMVVDELNKILSRKNSTSTQLIIGATEENDKTIITLAEGYYSKKLLSRVYYSAYIPVNTNLPVKISEPPLLREHRLYQADFLLRFYKFKSYELFNKRENLDEVLDPKLRWALDNMDMFPVDLNKADYNNLIRIPGIGPKSAKKILEARKYGYIDWVHLKKLGIPLKKAQYFIILNGKVAKKTPLELVEREIMKFYQEHSPIYKLFGAD